MKMVVVEAVWHEGYVLAGEDSFYDHFLKLAHIFASPSELPLGNLFPAQNACSRCREHMGAPVPRSGCKGRALRGDAQKPGLSGVCRLYRASFMT